MSADQNLKNSLTFIKMAGSGNDFVIFDARKKSISLNSYQIKKISDRKNIGCDQLIVIKKDSASDCFMEIYNSDGSISSACGNATRCVASILISESTKDSIEIKTAAGILKCVKDGELISVHMGIPKFDYKAIPLSEEQDSQSLSFFGRNFLSTNIGNPHAVTFIKEHLSDEEFFEIAPQIETDSIFLEKTNVEFAKIISDNLIEVRVWERGAGETLACGSGACAVGILAIKAGLIKSKKVTIRFKGGDLLIEWTQENSSVVMSGGYDKIFIGAIANEFLK